MLMHTARGRGLERSCNGMNGMAGTAIIRTTENVDGEIGKKINTHDVNFQMDLDPGPGPHAHAFPPLLQMPHAMQCYIYS
jgi:hypothetical protein